ncbi:FtsK/SpoIIIE domain-containing protein [Psychrobacillus sp. L4]|uniref:FtsK/SpoIIIE domain-containing protein n=1 Tax=Psychrobacillus sp. L4 TaxID=3236892 RepID=UPI0036F29EE3
MTMKEIERSSIAGDWVFDYIKQFINENQMAVEQKTILKVEHMPNEFIPAIINSIESRKVELANDLQLVLKTVQAVEGYETLTLQEHETIVWLRNNIGKNQIIVLVVNEERPEGQSLKDIVAINESVLLSQVGLDALRSYLEDADLLSVADINQLMKFIYCYQEITDMQLYTLVDFITQVVSGEVNDIHLKIAAAYPYLQLFKAKNIDLKNKQKFTKELRRNYYLGSLRKSMTQILNVEQLMNSGDRFITNERESGYSSSVWEIYENDVARFKQDIEDFLYRKNKNLLQIEYSEAEKVFNFKESRKLKDRLMNIYEDVQDRFDELIQKAEMVNEKSRLEDQKTQSETEIIEAINAIEGKTDIETIREFRENYQTELEEAGVIRSIKSLESKLETPSEYSDVITAVLSESIVLLEGLDNQDFEGKVCFKVLPRTTNLNEDLATALNFHLNLLCKFNKHMEVKLVTADETVHTTPEELTFDLEMVVINSNGETLVSEKALFALDCTMLDTKTTSFYEFIEKIKNEESLGYVEVRDGRHVFRTFESELELVRALSKIEDPALSRHIQYFQGFLVQYQKLLVDIVNGQFTNDVFDVLEKLVLDLLDHCYDSVNAVDKVYELFNSIATVRVLNQNDLVEQATLTVFHPMRLIGYMSKFIRLEKLYDELLDKDYAVNRVSEVADMKKYREYLMAKLGEVPPAYIARKSTGALYLLESERYGEGIYDLESLSANTLEKAELFATEVQRVTKDYLSVYPFAKDCLNVLFMYVTNESYIIKSIDNILKNTNVQKLNISIYSKGQSSFIYHRLSQWIKTREDLIVPLIHLGGLPKVEISLVPHEPDSSVLELVKNTLSDYDLAFFIDFLTQVSSSTIKKAFFETEVAPCNLTDHQWAIFDEVGYISSQGGSRHINYVAHELPEVLADFYNLQYIINKKDARLKSNKVQLLKAEITTAENEQNKLYEQMHDLFNWVVAYDKYIDPLIAKQITTKAEIIKYSIVQKAQHDVKVLISSSESLNRLLNETENYYYHDRLANRLKDLLGIKMIDSSVTQDIVLKTKSLSGASVLRSLGAGKFMHELLSIYLTLKKEEQKQVERKIHIWSACDELDWFRTKSKRPDLLHTIIEPDIENRKFVITLRLVELKLIHRQSYEQESTDALAQLNAGVETLRKYFGQLDMMLDKDNRLETFYKHLMHNRAYKPEELIYMRQLRMGTDWDIEFNFEKQADVYIYSHDDQFVDKTMISVGHYQDCYEEGQECNTYTRSYILNALKVPQEVATPIVEEYAVSKFEEHLSQVAEAFGLECEPNINEDEEIPAIPELDGDGEQPETPNEEDEGNLHTPPTSSDVESKPNLEEVKLNYPEVVALANITESHEPLAKRMENAQMLANNFKLKLESGLRQNNINLSIKNTIIGANIMRFEGIIPVTEKFSSIKAKESDMAMWLQIPDAPRVMNTGKVVIDVNRQNPDTIYFKEFMQFVRTQISAEDIDKKAVVPVGLSPLNEVMYMDLNDTIAHILVAGTTGSGKSVSLNAMVLAMMCLYDEQKLRFTFIDPKQVEFNVYKNVRHTDKVLTDLEETADYLEEIAALMDARYEKLSEIGARNIAAYNRRCRSNKQPEMSRLIIVFDEFADFMIQDKEIAKRIKDAIQRLGQKSRAAGIHLIICTQSPKADVIDTNTRNNLTGRICLRVSDSNASNVVIDEPGAELLAGKGDYLMRGNYNRLERGMSPYLDDETLDELLYYFKN